MTKKTILLNFSWLLFFLTAAYTFLVGQLYYLTTKGPDYSFYEPYFNYFLENFLRQVLSKACYIIF